MKILLLQLIRCFVLILIVFGNERIGFCAHAHVSRPSQVKIRKYLREPSLSRDLSRRPRSVTNENGKSLKEAYSAALKQSDSVNIQKELLYQLDETEVQARGALFPTLSGSASTLRQASPSSATGSSISPSEQNTVKLSLTQPLFRGFRDFATLRQKKTLDQAQYYTLLNAAKQLFFDLATAYYNVLAYEQDEANYLLEIEDNKRRLAELEGFYKIGRSQLTDVLTFRSSIASLERQLESVRGQLSIARDTLSFLTGWEDVALKNDESTQFNLSDLKSYLEKIEQRPDVQAAIANVLANDEMIPIAFGAHYPSVDLSANYYLARPGLVSSVNWDAQLALTIPIYQGGVIQSQVRQAQSVAHQYSLALSQARRLAEQEVKTFYHQLQSDLRQVQKLDELVGIAKENYETEIKYFRNGLVTNLDVITAMTTYQDAQRQLDHQKYSVQLDQVKLQAATGGRSEIDIEGREKPKLNFSLGVRP